MIRIKQWRNKGKIDRNEIRLISSIRTYKLFSCDCNFTLFICTLVSFILLSIFVLIV